jgi:hypothetical protein
VSGLGQRHVCSRAAALGDDCGSDGDESGGGEASMREGISGGEWPG